MALCTSNRKVPFRFNRVIRTTVDKDDVVQCLSTLAWFNKICNRSKKRTDLQTHGQFAGRFRSRDSACCQWKSHLVERRISTECRPNLSSPTRITVITTSTYRDRTAIEARMQPHTRAGSGVNGLATPRRPPCSSRGEQGWMRGAAAGVNRVSVDASCCSCPAAMQRRLTGSLSNVIVSVYGCE